MALGSTKEDATLHECTDNAVATESPVFPYFLKTSNEKTGELIGRLAAFLIASGCHLRPSLRSAVPPLPPRPGARGPSAPQGGWPLGHASSSTVLASWKPGRPGSPGPLSPCQRERQTEGQTEGCKVS